MMITKYVPTFSGLTRSDSIHASIVAFKYGTLREVYIYYTNLNKYVQFGMQFEKVQSKAFTNRIPMIMTD